ncbi:unnamed protein product [Closterium sp. NIES-65]|nr:unnamed protein product [Closterium sp. NIES-65]
MFGHANPGTDSHGSSGKGEMWWWGAADGHPSSPVELAVVPQKNSRSDDAEDTTTCGGRQEHSPRLRKLGGLRLMPLLVTALASLHHGWFPWSTGLPLVGHGGPARSLFCLTPQCSLLKAICSASASCQATQALGLPFVSLTQQTSDYQHVWKGGQRTYGQGPRGSGQAKRQKEANFTFF